MRQYFDPITRRECLEITLYDGTQFQAVSLEGGKCACGWKPAEGKWVYFTENCTVSEFRDRLVNGTVSEFRENDKDS